MVKKSHCCSALGQTPFSRRNASVSLENLLPGNQLCHNAFSKRLQFPRNDVRALWAPQCCVRQAAMLAANVCDLNSKTAALWG